MVLIPSVVKLSRRKGFLTPATQKISFCHSRSIHPTISIHSGVHAEINTRMAQNHPKSSNVQPKLNIHPNMHSKTIPCCHVHPIVHWLFPLTLPPLLAFIGLRLPQDLKSAASVVPIHHQHTGLALLGPRNSKGPGADRLKMGSPIFQNSNFSGNPFFLKSNVSE